MIHRVSFRRSGFTNPDGTKKDNAPPHWPFGALTEQQMRARARFEAKMRAGRLAKWPEGLY